MLPIILISTSDPETDSYLENFIKENNFSQDRIVEIVPLKKEIVISQVRDLRKSLRIASTLPRLFICKSFDKATTEAQNAFLKSLEEGGEKNQFILVVENEYALLPTIRSRSRVQKLQAVRIENKDQQKIIDFFKQVESAPDLSFLAAATLPVNARDELFAIFDAAIFYYRSQLDRDTKNVQIIKKILQFNNLVINNNLNPQLAYDQLLIFLNKLTIIKK